MSRQAPRPRYTGSQRLRSTVTIFILLCAGFICAGFMMSGSTLPVVPVTVTTTQKTTYYSVRGTTRKDIFEEIKANGLLDQDGQRSEGRTSAEYEMRMLTRESGTQCVPDSVRITLDIVLTLPRHERFNDLSEVLRERWQHFAAAIEAHEQRHVDIAVNGANSLKTRADAVVKDWMSCADLLAALRSLPETQGIETQKAHREFDADYRAEMAKNRKPLLNDLATKRARVAALTAELRQISATVDDLRRRRDVLRRDMDIVKADVANANGTCSRPTDDRIGALCRRYNALAANSDALAAKHSSVVAHRDRLMGEQTLLQESINELLETLAWVR
jgi:predicted secreted Zn-dependent protease